jgi:ABC-2 type transport system ATP-binding protein
VVETVDVLRARALRTVSITFSGPAPVEEFARLPGVQDMKVSGDTLTFALADSMDAVIKAAARHTVVSLVSQPPSLEEVFMAYYGGEMAGKG